MAKSVIGITKNRAQAERIINRLLESDFSNNDISLLMSNRESSNAGLTQTRPNLTGKEPSSLKPVKSTKAPEGATTGAVTGGIIGGTLGLLAGIGALAIPGAGPFIAAGPIMAALSGSALGGSVGLITGALVGLGIPEIEAKQFEKKLQAGNVLLSIHTDNNEEIEDAKRILKEEGAESISTITEKQKARLY